MVYMANTHRLANSAGNGCGDKRIRNWRPDGTVVAAEYEVRVKLELENLRGWGRTGTSF